MHTPQLTIYIARVMKKSVEIQHLKIEKNRWWNKGRVQIISQLLKGADKNAKIFEIGCAGGSLIQFLREKKFNNIWGIDISEVAINLCKKKEITGTFIMDGTTASSYHNTFDVVISSDVLEHMDGDAQALSEWHKILKPGGKLIVFVPAFNFLWSDHDKTYGHYRRYSKSVLIRVLKKVNFTIERCSYWNFSLFFLAFFSRFGRCFFKANSFHLRTKSSHLPSIINLFLTGLLYLENVFLKRLNFPVGISIFAVARK